MKSVLFLMVFVLAACSEPIATKYQDLSELEVPPTIEIEENRQQPVTSNQESGNEGAREIVSLAGSEQRPVINIKKLFDRSWNIVEQALKISDIEVKDKNRDLGVFYILFSPEQENGEESHALDGITSFFFNDSEHKSSYKLLVEWHENTTKVSADLVSEPDDDLLDDDEDTEDFERVVDNGSALINTLYKTIKNDLPIN